MKKKVRKKKKEREIREKRKRIRDLVGDLVQLVHVEEWRNLFSCGFNEIPLA